MNADDKIVVFTAAEVDALRNALAETSHVDSYLHEPVRALLARLDAISAASDAVVVVAGPTDMFSAEASEGHVVRCVIYGQDVGCKSVVVRGVYPVPEPVMVPWADARPGMVLVDRAGGLARPRATARPRAHPRPWSGGADHDHDRARRGACDRK